MLTGHIGFGLQIGTVPMNRQEAQAFASAVRSAVKSVGATILFEGIGQGTYEGVSEPSAALTFEFEGDLSGFSVNRRLETLRNLLADAADAFAQDCIALTLGSAELIGKH